MVAIPIPFADRICYSTFQVLADFVCAMSQATAHAGEMEIDFGSPAKRRAIVRAGDPRAKAIKVPVVHPARTNVSIN